MQIVSKCYMAAGACMKQHHYRSIKFTQSINEQQLVANTYH
jgi:hypothetical protein